MLTPKFSHLVTHARTYVRTKPTRFLIDCNVSLRSLQSWGTTGTHVGGSQGRTRFCQNQSFVLQLWAAARQRQCAVSFVHSSDRNALRRRRALERGYNRRVIVASSILLHFAQPPSLQMLTVMVLSAHFVAKTTTPRQNETNTSAALGSVCASGERRRQVVRRPWCLSRSHPELSQMGCIH